MPQTSEKFAQDTYNQIKGKIREGLISIGMSRNALPYMMMIAEEHTDTKIGKGKEPARQAAYAELAALEAAVNLVGSNKVVLTVELPPEAVEDVKNRLAQGQNLEAPVYIAAIKRAMELNVPVIGTDVNLQAGMINGETVLYGPAADARDLAMIDVKRQVGQANPGKVIIDMGGAKHLAFNAGISNEEIIYGKGTAQVSAEKSPYKDIYGHVDLVNASYLNRAEIETYVSGNLPDQYLAYQNRFATNPENALQVHAAGFVLPSIQDIQQDVLKAAKSVEQGKAETGNNLYSELSAYSLEAQRVIMAQMAQNMKLQSTSNVPTQLNAHANLGVS